MKLTSFIKPQPQSAIDLLKTQHEEVKTLFKRIEKASTRAAKTNSSTNSRPTWRLTTRSSARSSIRPARRAMGMTDLLGEALVEHGVVEFSLYQADQARKDKDFSFKCQVLSEIVEHHVKEEEEDFFPKVQKALGKEKLVELGARMAERFEQAKAKDYHPALKSNLRQVLAGALKPSKRASRKSPALPASKRRKAA